jgi:hypothetical protein
MQPGHESLGLISSHPRGYLLLLGEGHDENHEAIHVSLVILRRFHTHVGTVSPRLVSRRAEENPDRKQRRPVPTRTRGGV